MKCGYYDVLLSDCLTTQTRELPADTEAGVREVMYQKAVLEDGPFHAATVGSYFFSLAMLSFSSALSIVPVFVLSMLPRTLILACSRGGQGRHHPGARRSVLLAIHSAMCLRGLPTTQTVSLQGESDSVIVTMCQCV